MWLPLGIAALIALPFLLALYLGEQEERPSEIHFQPPPFDWERMRAL
jgi:hypothetical protein